MKVEATSLPGVLVIEPRVFADGRGLFLETYAAARYAEVGVPAHFVQDNFSRSRRGTVRGLHFQEPEPQGKLVQVLRGVVFDVAVDIRRGSPTFGRWVGVELSDETMRQLWIPPGFAHGFCVLSEVADFHYKCTAAYRPDADRAIRWNDPDIGIAWPDFGEPLLSPKDAAAPLLREAPTLP
jgi:dTDP-4-dehydrorhamnose 3,5-epimerase